MSEDRDHFGTYYAERLWSLLPGIYRTLDSDDEMVKGPLRELVERLGTQIAIVRRSIDRTWEDQSIESCDDWLIPYIGEVLATNIVAGLSPSAQRRDVARTICYRRRKGTLAILEEITADITGWNIRAVEFFTRLTRTRHLFDPKIGTDTDAAIIAGLRGARSLTARGGFANLRHATAAASSTGAFDEFSHTADFRRGADASGWHNIPKLGVFAWRLKSFGCSETTPVEYASCPGQFTFDPTGRETQLFAKDIRDKSQYGDAWVTPDEWMLPTPITQPLFAQASDQLYPKSLAVLRVSDTSVDELPLADVDIEPDRGRFCAPRGVVARVRYHYGFASMIGAGPYDRRALIDAPPQQADPSQTVTGGKQALTKALAGPPAFTKGTLSIDDSLSYDGPVNLGAISQLTIRCEHNQRPVIRSTGRPWTLTGTGRIAQLALEGLLVSGGDIVLQGAFEEVDIFCSTLDPGEAFDSSGSIPLSVDNRQLLPTTLWIEGEVKMLRVRRSILGPVRTRGLGRVAKIEISDSIVQDVRVAGSEESATTEILDARQLAKRWKSGKDPLTAFLRKRFGQDLRAELTAYAPKREPGVVLIELMSHALLKALTVPLYDKARFAHLPLPPKLKATAAAGSTGDALKRINRLLLEAAYPAALAPAAIASIDTELTLSHTTCLGAVYARRINASESILSGFTRATDVQNGCVRFSAYADGSRLRQPYESVAIRSAEGLFVSQRYADPGYAQLSRLADREIIADDKLAASILAGAQNGSEMGAFCSELNAIKERGLELKLKEYMPIGLTPVLIYVT